MGSNSLRSSRPTSAGSPVLAKKSRRRRYVPDRTEERSREQLCSLVRNILIARLDDLAADKVMGPALEEIGLSDKQWLDVLQKMQIALFPEEFCEIDSSVAITAGLIPRSARLGRVSWEKFREFADQFLTRRGK